MKPREWNINKEFLAGASGNDPEFVKVREITDMVLIDDERLKHYDTLIMAHHTLDQKYLKLEQELKDYKLAWKDSVTLPEIRAAWQRAHQNWYPQYLRPFLKQLFDID